MKSLLENSIESKNINNQFFCYGLMSILLFYSLDSPKLS
jgi:hypothetical protein